MNGKPLYVRGGRRPVRNKTKLSRLAAAVLVLLAIVVNYFVFFRGDDSEASRSPALDLAPTAPATRPAEDGGPGTVPSASDEAVPGDDTDDATAMQVFAGELGSGDRMLDALQRIGLDRGESRKVVRAMDRVFDFRGSRPGDRFRLEVDPAGRVDHFAYVRSQLEIYEVTRDGETYEAAKRDIQTVVEVTSFGCVLRDGVQKGLLGCARDAGLAARLSELLAPTVDLASETRDGDELRVVLEKVLAEGEFLRYGRVLAVDYRGKLAQARFYLHTPEEGEASYFLADGGSLARKFLRSPIRQHGEGAYRGGRIRPALHRYKRHVGLDYPVSKGTPIVAVGAGTIGHAGPKGTSGTLVSVRHPGGTVTYYAHLSRLASGLRKGRRVAQGELIAYSGDSGRTTDPQLHFAMKVKGSFVNPLERRGEPTQVVFEGDKERFEGIVQQMDALFETVPVFDSEVDA